MTEDDGKEKKIARLRAAIATYNTECREAPSGAALTIMKSFVVCPTDDVEQARKEVKRQLSGFLRLYNADDLPTDVRKNDVVATFLDELSLGSPRTA